jgi:hypothetical protein
MEFEDVVLLIQGCRDEEEYAVWSGIEGVLGALAAALVTDRAVGTAFSAFVIRLATQILNKLGWIERPLDGHLDKLLRAVAIRLVTGHTSDANSDVTKEAQRLFKSYVNDPAKSDLAPEIRSAVFALVLRLGDASAYTDLKRVYEQLTDNAEKKQIMSSLGNTSVAALKKQTMEWALNEVLLQDFFYPMSGVASSGPEGKAIAWNFLKDNFAVIKAKLATASSSLMDAVIHSCTTGFNTKDDLAAFDNFFKENVLPQSTRTIRQKLESVGLAISTSERVLGSAVGNAAFWEKMCVA